MGTSSALGRGRVQQAGETRSARIESLRALAALAVVVGHVWVTSVGTADTYLHRAALGGGFGVFLFFALSGYLLYRPFARRDFAGGTPVQLWRYALNRALRILPLYYAVVLVLLVVLGHGDRHLWLRFPLMIQGFFPDTVIALDGPLWSLVVEVQYYLLLPFIAAFVALASTRRLVMGAAAVLGLGLASAVLREVTVQLPAHPSEVWRYSFLTNFVFFVPGMLLPLWQVALERRKPGWMEGVASRSSAWLCVAAAAWLLTFVNYSWWFVILVAAFLTVAACVLPLRPGRGVRALEWRPLALVGVASYSLYIWHDPIVGRLPRLGLPAHNFWIQLAVAIPLMLVIAAVSYRAIEAPWLRWRSAWSRATPLGGGSEEQGALADAPQRAGGNLHAVKQEEPT